MIKFREVNIDDAQMILQWRMSSRITRFMNTDVLPDLYAQKEWIISSYGKSKYYHWIIEIDGKPVGLINISEYSPSYKTTSWGYYIGEEDSVGLGAFIPPYLYNFLFSDLLVKCINIDVFYNNINAIELHLLHGYKFSPDRDRVIHKNNKEILLISMSLHKDIWNSNRFSSAFANFPINNWKAAPLSLIKK